MENYKIEEEKRTAEQYYIEYIDRCRRNTGKSRLEIHRLITTQNVGRYYGLDEMQLDYIGKKLEDEEK